MYMYTDKLIDYKTNCLHATLDERETRSVKKKRTSISLTKQNHLCIYNVYLYIAYIKKREKVVKCFDKEIVI